MLNGLIDRMMVAMGAITLTGSLAAVAMAGTCGGAKTDAVSNAKAERSCASSCAESGSAMVMEASYQRGEWRAQKDIVDTAVGAGSFKTLVAAVQAAGLVETLKGDGPFTVFAPTDEAFAKLPGGTVENLLKPENRGLLTAILTYHVVPAKVTAEKVVGLDFATTANGQRADISVRDGGVFVDGARVVKTDIMASNGVIHVIDAVIMPETSNLVEVASSAGQFATLLAAAEAAGLVGTLTGDQAYTILAPTDDAFKALPAGTVESLLKPENRSKLRDILTYHVIPGRVFAEQAIAADRAATVNGKTVNFGIRDGRLTVNGANLVGTDIEASNGVIHVIDRVILPE
ncbi:MAG: fasciclin domain-containing protein [Phycisphaerales bacterium]